MKRIFQPIISFCLLFITSYPVMAEQAGPFAGVYLGGNALMNAEGSDNLGSFELKFDPGLLGSAVCGWNFEPGNKLGEGRIELEYSHRSNQLDQVKFVEGSFQGDGKVVADSLLLNFFAVYHDKDRWSPYFGGGIGAARIEAVDLQVTGHSLSSDADVVFAYQLGVGCEYALTDRLSLDLGYRYFSSSRPEFSEPDGRLFKMDYLSHNVVLGLKLGF